MINPNNIAEKIIQATFARLGLPQDGKDGNTKQYAQATLIKWIYEKHALLFDNGLLTHEEFLETCRAAIDSLDLIGKEAFKRK